MAPVLACRPALLALALFASCVGPRPDVDEVLENSTADGLTEIVERAASAGLARADRHPESTADQVEAAALLFYAAEVRLVRAAVARIAVEDPPTAEALLALEDRIEPELAADVGALCAEGRARAARALELEPGNVAAQHYLALHTVLALQVEGAARALFRVGGAVRAMERTIEMDAAFEDGAPLLLLGRFRDRAPWPHQDRPQAISLLEEAAERRPTPLRLLYLGDALFGLGSRHADALATWRSAAEASAPPFDPETKLAPLYRDRARARLECEGQSWGSARP